MFQLVIDSRFIFFRARSIVRCADRERERATTLRCSSWSRKRFANRFVDGRSRFHTLVHLTCFNGALNGTSEVEVNREWSWIDRHWNNSRWKWIGLFYSVRSFLPVDGNSFIPFDHYVVSISMICVLEIEIIIILWNSYCSICILYLYIWKKIVIIIIVFGELLCFILYKIYFKKNYTICRHNCYIVEKNKFLIFEIFL